MTIRRCAGIMALDLRGMPEEVRAQVRRLLEEAASAREETYACVVVGVLFGLWIVEGPFFGRSPAQARMEAVESFISFGAARYVGPFRVASLRAGRGESPVASRSDVALRPEFG
jgi:hypothetical protein